jgi:16S rRNA (adenine1518-N6/adenine1519-N6)-dimethyltransferase
MWIENKKEPKKSKNYIIKPKRSLGQNFLVDKNALEKIIKAANLSSLDNVLEIGPGTGLLTNELVKNAKRVIMVEKDERLANLIASNFKFKILNSGLISNTKEYSLKIGQGVISGDFLDINLPKLIEDNNFQNYKVVANIPYYITGQILRLLLEVEYSPKLLVLMLQKEVAQRICAKPGKMSILSVSVQYYGFPEIISHIPRESFNPAPEVDSAIVRIVPKKNMTALRKKRRKFFRLVKMGFSSPRKTLSNNLSAGLKIDRKMLEEAFLKINLETKVRAQELSIEDWKGLLAQLT